MKVCVAGLWHLGSVTAACIAAGGHRVKAYDPDPEVVARLRRGAAPLFEPGLDDLLSEQIDSRRLTITDDASEAAGDADVVWITADTPVDDEDRGDVDAVVAGTMALFQYLRDGALVLLSSQVTAGTTRRLEEAIVRQAAGRTVTFAYSPENLRLGNAIRAFTEPDRVVVGIRREADRERITQLFAPFTTNIEWMSVESAEMTKHALNAFLATSITFINEIASICEQVGADAAEVARGLKSDRRIGPRAYLSPGGAFAGGTLARDVGFLTELARQHHLRTPLIPAVRSSNDAHRDWPQRRLGQLLGPVAGKTVAVWGLTYKPGTSTLRRSQSVEVCEWLVAAGAAVVAHDPAVTELPSELSNVRLAPDALAAVGGADALVIATPWPEYKEVDAAATVTAMRGDLVLDANGFLASTLGAEPRLRYVRVGQHLR